MKLLIRILMTLFSLSLITSCGSSGSSAELNEYGYEAVQYAYFEVPEAFTDSILYTSIISDYENSLDGKKIFLDPGHGGTDKGNVARDTSVSEAKINFNVAGHLKSFLEEAGCEVLMSREGDDDISIDDRTELANYSGSDIMVSIHHNAASDETNFRTNYTSTYYHSSAGETGYEPYEHNLAKFIQRDLAYAMRNPGSLASFDGTLPDNIIPGQEEYDLLYKTNIPAVLVECGFLTNRLEETRLTIEKFNRIEAWGIFNGIAKFFKQDIPEIIIDEDESSISFGGLRLVFGTSDGYATDTSSISVSLDGDPVGVEFNPGESNFVLQLDDITNGEHDLKIIYSNRKNIPAKPFERKIIIK